MISYRIIPMTEAVLPEVITIDKELFPHDFWSQESFLSSIKMHQTYCVLIESAGKKVIAGYIVFSSAIDEGELLHLGVAKQFQKRGLARALLAFMEDFGTSNKITKWFLEVRHSNNPAISLYKKLGFKTVGIRKNYYKNLSGKEDALGMVKEKAC